MKNVYWAIIWTLGSVFFTVTTAVLPTYPVWPWITTLIISLACLVPARNYIKKI